MEAFSNGHGTGSTFRVWLPILEESMIPKKHVMDAETPNENEQAISRNIVLIEDVEDSRTMMSTLLTLDGHVVYAHADGETGVDAIAQHQPHIALVDIGLPGIDGYEVARRTRSNSKCNNTLLVALTGYGQRADIEKARVAGFDSHLVKPIDFEQLDELLQRLGAD